MYEAILLFLVLLNPVAMFIFLTPVIRKLSPKDLMSVLAKASVVAFAIFALFAVSGDLLFKHVLQVQFDSLRIFGGMIITYMSFVMIVGGAKSFITYNEDHTLISSQIVMPLMVGAGTISQSVLMGKSFGKIDAVIALAAVTAMTYVSVVSLTLLRGGVIRRVGVGFDQNMDMALRLIAFFAGAIGINMILVGLTNVLG